MTSHFYILKQFFLKFYNISVPLQVLLEHLLDVNPHTDFPEVVQAERL